MEREFLEEKLSRLQEERRKGVALIEETKAKVLRIEGAIIQLQELLKETGKNQGG